MNKPFTLIRTQLEKVVITSSWLLLKLAPERCSCIFCLSTLQCRRSFQHQAVLKHQLLLAKVNPACHKYLPKAFACFKQIACVSKLHIIYLSIYFFICLRGGECILPTEYFSEQSSPVRSLRCVKPILCSLSPPGIRELHPNRMLWLSELVMLLLEIFSFKFCMEKL